jgi:putative transcriptional regulator
MAIVVNLDVVMAQRKMSLNDLSEKVGVSLSNLSILKTGKARAIRFSTLESLCEALDCQPGDLLEFNTRKEMKHLKSYSHRNPSHNNYNHWSISYSCRRIR